jgi:hypothetical protein
MTYTVIWLEAAEDLLATAYLEAVEWSRAEAFTRAIIRAEERLRTTPSTAGESRDRRQRFLVERPAAVTYEMHADERIVVVLRVSYLPPRG